MSHSSRLIFNLEILDFLKRFAKLHPDLRFFQLLVASGIIKYLEDNNIQDDFYKESKDSFIELRKKF